LFTFTAVIDCLSNPAEGCLLRGPKWIFYTLVKFEFIVSVWVLTE
jgi:hypothetical protein